MVHSKTQLTIGEQRAIEPIWRIEQLAGQFAAQEPLGRNQAGIAGQQEQAHGQSQPEPPRSEQSSSHRATGPA